MKTQNINSTGRLQKALVGAAILALATAVLGDDLTGEDEFLCATASVIVCADNGTCTSAMPWELNVPQFIAVDLDERSLATTEASGERRATTVDTVKRINGRIYLQGVDRGRAYSFVIDEASGFMTVAVARDDLTVTVFGACTPTP
ncbi:MAG: hypothetical protein IIA07_11875 [Proteobacteria bacterium]|nr:hypothetical protein [Pseudomonadota bacterium]